MKKKLRLTIKAEGETFGDLADAVRESLRLIEQEYQSGFNSNDTGRFHFDVKGA